ncbi:hypothetical protein L6164_004105 [Bauhinia variegata]|uniref:Uncharacterized protein n=1 Tax=Bauhinia variegata TaxID=167791 RepID=A0ACB9Q628_BAUVA|nr:hypothetical protein L6164_004105 [Bauhinia variegata]
MERLEGPINSCFFGEQLEVNCFEQGFIDAESFGLEEDELFFMPNLDDKMPFLQMLQSVESPQLFPFKETNFQTLLKLQQTKKPWGEKSYLPRMDTQIQTLELESCVTHDMVEMQSPLKSESNDFQNPHSASCFEVLGSECNKEGPKSAKNCTIEANIVSPATWTNPESWLKEKTQCPKPQLVGRERRKRKRTRPAKSKVDVENQRMTHIAVERNRRRQMNDHLTVLRSLMPPSYVQRGDQASIIGGAIDFVKELEQLLQSLESQKRVRKNEEIGCSSGLFKPSTPDNGTRSTMEEGNRGDEVKAENKSETADIEVTVIQNHVNMKIQCQRRPGQLLKAIVALEDLRLTILHLNITSAQGSVLYSFNLKIEEDCKLGSATEIAEAVHQIFNFINGN